MTLVRALRCAVGTALLFGAGCGVPVEDNASPTAPTPSEATPEDGDIKRAAAVYMLCWPALGVYNGPSTSSYLHTTLHRGSGNNFEVLGNPILSEGEYWAPGRTTIGRTEGYVRWNGLCH